MQNNQNSGSVSGVKEIFTNLKKVFQDEPISLEDLRASLQEDLESQPDFTNLLEKHHNFLEESIRVLVDQDAPTVEKQAHLERFLAILDMHARAEEETLYQSLKHATDKEARLESLAGQDEHDVAYQLGLELEALKFQTEWSEQIDAKAQVLALLVQNHIEKEESKMFSIAEAVIAPDKIVTLTDLYLQKCKIYLDQTLNLRQ